MKVATTTTIHDLIEAVPALREGMSHISPKFENLKNPVIYQTMARVATLETAAAMSGLPIEELMRQVRQQILKSLILDLHGGLDIETASQRFADLLGGTDSSEIAAMEQSLMAEGLPASEIKRLCSVHTRVFRSGLEANVAAKPFGVAPDHPLHPFMAWNRSQEEILERLEHELELIAGPDCSAPDACDSCGVDHTADEGTLSQVTGRTPVAAPDLVINQGMFELGWKDLDRLVSWLAANDAHYKRKENALFPLLEKHGITAPSQVMWAVQDDIRDQLKAMRAALDAHAAAAFIQASLPAITAIRELIYKEENILYPLSVQKLEAADWQLFTASYEDAAFTGSRSQTGQTVAYGVATSAGTVVNDSATTPNQVAGPLPLDGTIDLDTGRLQPDQLNLILKALPVDVSFVNEHDEVAYYSDGPHRVFPRSPSVIGRKVQFCHPPKSVATVQKILDDFRSGVRSEADFWIQLHGRFIYIKYNALRDSDGKYRGCLEASQDLTALRALDGEKRLVG